LGGVIDPDGDAVTIDVAGVAHDEPMQGRGILGSCPDAIVEGERLLIRAERARRGDGRTYRVTVTGSDGRGGLCRGTATVCVPADARNDSCAGRAPIVDALAPDCTERCAALCAIEGTLGAASCSDGAIPDRLGRRLSKVRRLLELAAESGPGDAGRHATRAKRRLEGTARALDRNAHRNLSPACEAAVRSVLERSLVALGDLTPP
jgi:hypothetical protein